MSKRYVIQVLTTNVLGDQEWVAYQFDNSGDPWMTRRRSTAIADAAKILLSGETRELRVVISEPVYSLTPSVSHTQIQEAADEHECGPDCPPSDVNDDAELTEVLETQVGDVPDAGDEPSFETTTNGWGADENEPKN